ncbi:hypothetical protein M5689_004941 [Euphorbia peplus]|nr:hypothetical protein M5689_004941 [Euphorbia peplus]
MPKRRMAPQISTMAENMRPHYFLPVHKGGDLSKKDVAFKAKYDLVESVESLKKTLGRFPAAAADMMECIANMESMQSIVSTPVPSPALTEAFSEISLKIGTSTIAFKMLRELITGIEKISAEATVAMEALQASVVDVTNHLECREFHVFVTNDVLVAVLLEVAGSNGGLKQVTAQTLFEPMREACKKKGIRADFSVEQVEAVLAAELSKW